MSEGRAQQSDSRQTADAADETPEAERRRDALTRSAQAAGEKLWRKLANDLWNRGGGQLWFWGLLIGIGAGYAVLGFRLAIQSFQFVSFGAFHERVADAAANLAWYEILTAPVIGGFVVAGLLFLGREMNWLSETRAENVADVIEARAVRNGHIDWRATGLSALIASVSLGAGASAGREGPAVHLGAGIGAVIAEGLNLPARAARTLLACGAAAAISASFDAPIAGVLFALEVILGHYALRVIAPVAISSLAASVVVRAHLGAQVAFPIPDLPDTMLTDFPLAALLGFLCALAAMAYMRMTLEIPSWIARMTERLTLPLWILPPFGGLLIGMVALAYPEVLGVGYEGTTSAIAGSYSIGFLLALVIAKLFATALTLGFRFGGGVFSPSIFVGAMVGAAFGGIVDQTGLATAGESFFAVIGMGAVAGAVIGAPISTTLIVFELTRSYEAGAAMLVAVSIATVVVQAMMGGSIFQIQIKGHGLEIAAGPQRIILQTVRVRDFMTPIGRMEKETAMESASLYEDDSLGRALALLKAEDLDGAGVKRRGGDEPITGYVSRTDALLAYNNALVDAHIEQSR